MDCYGCGWSAGAGQTKNPRLGQPWVLVKVFDQQEPAAPLTTATTSTTTCDTFFNISRMITGVKAGVKSGFLRFSHGYLVKWLFG